MARDKMDDALDAYLSLLQNKGAEAAVIDFRRRVLARLNQILRSQRGGAAMYRPAVDALLSLCAPVDRAGAMLAAREYYYFWLDDVKRLAALHARDGFSTRGTAGRTRRADPPLAVPAARPSASPGQLPHRHRRHAVAPGRQPGARQLCRYRPRVLLLLAVVSRCRGTRRHPVLTANCRAGCGTASSRPT